MVDRRTLEVGPAQHHTNKEDGMPFDDEYETDFQDPGGRSALRAATKRNPRNLPCPTCGEPNRLTPADVRCGYQCDACADAAERGC